MDLSSKDLATTEFYLFGLCWLSFKAWKSGDTKPPMPHLSQKCPVRLYTQLLNDFSVSAFEGEMFGIQTGLEIFDLVQP